ncbi:FAD/NAD(P)-binding oxidoreductase [Rhodobacteraceae bacterium KMM 6894]|nr:FAD/NAD(P)-binding oxidoreductase [Rhodobacteraceae bacterium KMM 6894]
MQVDLIVIGAGPAGMVAARQAAEAGLSVALLDEQQRAGGQIYRDVQAVPEARAAILGPDYTHGAQLARDLAHDNITHIAGATVWIIEDGSEVGYLKDGAAHVVKGRRILIATGALERPMPVPGWTLPGVMAAGAGQILLKQSGVVSKQAVLVGSGPLLYLIAAQMVRAGHPPLAMVETQTTQDFVRAARHFPSALRGWRYLTKGLTMIRALKKAGVRRYTGATQITIEGRETAEAVSFVASGKRHSLPCQTVFLHHGVVPNTQAARSLDIPHHWNAAQQCFVPERDTWGRSSIENVFLAGDGTGIAGAKSAALAGHLAALQIATDLKRLTPEQRDTRAAPLHRALAQDMAARPFLDAAYPPYAGAMAPADSTIICRCEEVTAGDIRATAKLGCLGPNQTKAFGRAGMGPCQGRYCGLTVTHLLAEANGLTPDQTGAYRIRAPIKPVTLGELSKLNNGPPASEAH